jgi:hypothetical protein
LISFLRYYDDDFKQADGDDGAKITELIELVLNAYPAATTKLTPIEDNSCDISDAPPLHLAARNCPVAVVEMIYEANPDAISYVADGESGTPFRQGVYNNRDAVSVINYLYSKYPDAIHVPDELCGRLPLHWSVKESSLAGPQSCPMICTIQQQR